MPAIPQTQTAIQIHENGGPENLKLEQVPVPEVPKDGLLIKNQFAGVNYIDTYFRRGIYPTAKFPYTPGGEGEGTVIAVGPEVKGFNVGDRVVYSGGKGTYAQITATPALHALKIDDSIKPGYGAAVLLQGLTALYLVKDVGEVKPGDWVAVTAAAGGVGTILVQLLKKHGAKVIASTSTQEKRDLVKKLGADYVVGYENWEKDVLEITGGKGVRVVLDSLGKDTFDSALNIASRRGIVATYGNATGKVPPFDLYRTAQKGIKVIRPSLFAYVETREEFEEYAKELFDWIANDKPQIFIHKIYPLEQAPQVHIDIESRGTIGKLLIEIPQ